MVSKLDRDEYVRIQSDAVAVADSVAPWIAEQVRNGAPNLFLIGTGGAGILAEPAYKLLRAHSSLPVFHDKTAELLRSESSALREGSIVVVLSLSGTTGESIEYVERAKQRGARVVVLTANDDSPLAKLADQVHAVEAADPTSSESYYLQLLIIALSVLDARDEFVGANDIIEELRRLPELLYGAKDQFEQQAAEVAAVLDTTDYHIVTSSGSAWPEAWYYAMCILEEMQWIRTRPIHAADFFHGTLELVERGVSVVVMKGEDASRPIAERVEQFVPQVTDLTTVIDTASIQLSGISDEVRALISPAVLAAILERVSAHVEALRRHPLETRRYYRRLPY